MECEGHAFRHRYSVGVLDRVAGDSHMGLGLFISAAITLTLGQSTVAPVESTPIAAPVPADAIDAAVVASRPRFRVDVEGMYLRSDQTHSQAIATQIQMNSQGLLSRQNVAVSNNPQSILAPRVALAWMLEDGGSWRVSGFYLGGPDQKNSSISSFDSTYFLSATAADPLQRGYLTGLPAGFPSLADRMTTNWRLQVWEVEANRMFALSDYGAWLNGLSIGAGVGYFRTEETLSVQVNDQVNGLSGTLGSNTSNDLVGPQFLARFGLNVFTQRIVATGGFRFGTMANFASDKTSVAVSGATVGSANSSGVQFTPLVDLNCELAVTVWGPLQIFGGYQFLYMDGMNRAVEQIRVDLNAFTTAHAEQGAFTLQGPRFGLRAQY